MPGCEEKGIDSTQMGTRDAIIKTAYFRRMSLLSSSRLPAFFFSFLFFFLADYDKNAKVVRDEKGGSACHWEAGNDIINTGKHKTQ